MNKLRTLCIRSILTGAMASVAAAIAIAPAVAQSTGSQAGFARFLYTINGFKADQKFLAPTGLAVDQGGNLVYVCDNQQQVVYAFSLQGSGKFKIGEKNELEDPIAIAVDRGGNLYVCERKPRKIKVFDRRNSLAAVIDLGALDEPAKVLPGRLSVNRDGEIAVVDQANQQIVVFDKQRKLKLKFGNVGDRPGEFRTIEDVAIDKQNRFYVVDSAGVPVQVFDKTGAYVSSIGSRSDIDGLVQPVALTIDRFDELWLVDTAEHKIRIFDRVGFPLQTLGEYGMKERSLFYPVDVDLDSTGRIYILEKGSRRLQVFEMEKPYQPIQRSR